MKLVGLLFLLVSDYALAETFSLVCEVRPVANDRIVSTRTYVVDTEKQTVDAYAATFSDAKIIVEKPFIENAPHRDKLAVYTFDRRTGQLEIASPTFGVAPFRGVCQRASLRKF